MTRDHTLFDDFELQGYWWLPERDDHKVPGRLVRKGQEMTLHLLDALVERSLQEMCVVSPPPRPEVVFGWLDDGRPCTLYKTFQSGSTHNSSGFQTSKFSARMLFLGKHIATPDSVPFSAMAVSHTHTEDWLLYNPFDSGWPKSDGTQITTEAKYASFPVQKFAVLTANATVSLEPAFWGTHSFRHHEWHHTVLVRVALSAEPTLGRYLDVLTDCRNLLTLFVGEPVQARTITAYLDRPAREGEETDPEKVQVFFGQRAGLQSDEVNFTDMIVTYPAVRDRLGDIVTNWLTKADELRTVAELYFGTLYNKGLYLRFQLLSLAQAVECYSRLRLHPRDNKGFRARVEELLGTLQPATVTLVCQDAAYFAEVVTDTRDYFTHYLDKHKAKAPDGADLFMLTRRVWLLLTVLLFKEVGLDEPFIVSLIGQHPKLVQWLKPHPLRPAGPACSSRPCRWINGMKNFPARSRFRRRAGATRRCATLYSNKRRCGVRR